MAVTTGLQGFGSRLTSSRPAVAVAAAGPGRAGPYQLDASGPAPSSQYAASVAGASASTQPASSAQGSGAAVKRDRPPDDVSRQTCSPPTSSHARTRQASRTAAPSRVAVNPSRTSGVTVSGTRPQTIFSAAGLAEVRIASRANQPSSAPPQP
ncbi:MAG: hypothetical protein C0395_04720 [Gemmatimonas sp.]|nr:hypothetical protein [Gemmatimonas sp.]